MNHSNWIPEIMYEEETDGSTQNLPFILVPTGEEMPKFLLLWEHRQTGEFEPGPDGEELPIVDAELWQYAKMDVLKSGLTSAEYDRVREVLGLEPLKAAAKKGRAITERAVSNSLTSKSKTASED